MPTGINLEVVDEAIKKYGSRKNLIAIVGIAAISLLEIPEMLEPKMVVWVIIAKAISIAAVGCTYLGVQYKLDKEPTEEPPAES